MKFIILKYEPEYQKEATRDCLFV